MQTIEALVSDLSNRGITLRLEDGRLRYAAPQGALTPQDLAKLRARKPELIAFLQGAQQARDGGQQRLRTAARPVDWRVGMPVSFAQQRLWFLQRFDAGATAYNEYAGLRLLGSLDLPALLATVHTIVQRHEMLRTTFPTVAGLPRQRIDPHLAPTITMVDLQAMPAADGAGRAQALLDDVIHRPFDLAQGPLLRLLICRCTPTEHLLVFTLHHIVGDVWSTAVLARELTLIYAAYAARRPHELAPLTVQYADFAVHQRHWLDSESADRQRGYWREQLRGLPAMLALPTDRPRRGQRSETGGETYFQMDSRLRDACRSLAQRHEATLFMVLLANFAVLLARLSGQRDFAIGSPIANRDRPELEPLIGLLVNLVVLRCDLHNEPDFATVLQRTRKVVLNAFAHQDVPFEQVVDVVQPVRAADHQPLFQVVFALQNLSRATLQLPGLTLAPISPARPTAKFDLMLQMTEGDHGLSGRFEYAADLFDEATVVQMGNLFAGLLKAATASPHLPVGRLPWLNDRERQHLLRGMQSPVSDMPVTCLHTRFFEQARQHPDAVALVGPSPSRPLPVNGLSYGKLANRARYLAGELRSYGVRPGDRVVILLPRDVRVGIAILAVLHCGAAYVPIDPDYPLARRKFLLEDTQPRVVVSDDVLQGWPCVGLTWQPDTRQLPSVALPVDSRDAWLPAYHIHTSGSTGQPKGVVVSHRNVARLLMVGSRLFEFNGNQVWSWFHSYAFDFSVWEMWGAWWVGARTVQVPVPWTMASHHFARFLRDQAVTVLNQTPSAFYALSQTDLGQQLPHLRWVIFGGEALSPARLAAWQACHPQVRLVNMYGITETTVHVTAQVLAQDQVRADRSVLGEPLADLQLLLLDAWLEPVPNGVPGLLYVAGAGLSQGYWGRPGLTAARFVPNPYADRPGDRLYHSGDLALRNHYQEYIYLGRADAQVQLRGFRIEPGEVAAVLSTAPAVDDVAVVLRHDETQPQLVAYVVGQELVDSELRALAEQQLPAHQVPAVFVHVPRLPRTAHGKLDRDALPRPQRQVTIYTAPRTEVERVVCAVWADVLGRERIGVDDHFFALGGHSLLAASVTAALYEQFGIELPLRDFFSAPTPAGQAAAIERLRQVNTALPAPRRLLPDERVPLSFAQERLWFLERLEAGIYNVPFALSMRGVLDVAALERALRRVAERQSVLTAIFPSVAGQPRLDHLALTSMQITTVDQTALAQPEQLVKDMVGAMAGLQFDLERGPLIHSLVIQLTQQRWILLVTLHHTIADGHGTAILLNEWTAAYRGAIGFEMPPLTTLPATYGDFAAWQREAFEQGHMDEAQEYWRRHLADAPSLLLLPTDHPRPPVQDFHGSLVTVPHDPDVVTRLHGLAQKFGTTPFVVFQAGLALLLSRLAAQPDLLLATPATHRRHPWWQPLLGLFLNTVVFRHRVELALSCEQWLIKVRDEVQRAFSHGDVPFERVVDMLDLPRTRSHNPLFQVMLIQQPPPAPLPQLPGLHTRPLPSSMTKSKFDLSVYIAHDGQQAAFEYSTALLDEATIQQWGTYWRRILAALVDDQTACLGDVQLIDTATRHQLLQRWHCDNAEPQAPADLAVMWAGQLAQNPDRIAISDGWVQLTYRQVDRMMRCCAGGLKARGVRSGDVVGVALSRSCALPIAVLGIWAAGAAYLPLDPTYPKERRRSMQRIARCCGVIGETPTATWRMADLLCNEPAACRPSDAAYVIFTSGSTGQPKGVWMGQAPLARLIRWQIRGREPARTLNFTSLGFDVAFQEMWSTWASGGALVLVNDVVRRDPEALIDWLRTQYIARLFLPFAALQHLAESAQDEAVDLALREITTAGETLLVTPALRAFCAALPACQLNNHYGPSETHVVTAHRLTGTPATWSQRPPIGRPVAAATVYVLDQWLQPVAPGLTGQLALGGALAFGYVSAPALTAARFVPHPYSEAAGERLYLSGDLARFNRRGELDFLGRRDFQCKLRGYRVELMEVEQVLAAVAGVTACAVVAHGDHVGGPVTQLSAFYVSPTDNTVTTEVLRQRLGQKLPAFMVPSQFISLTSLPTLPNGKVDRMGLVQQACAERAVHAPSGPPQGRLETLIAASFAEVLNLDKVGRDCDFFTVGGHSLSAARVMARIRRETEQVCPLGWLFDAPTPATLAALLSREMASCGSPFEPLRPVPRDQPLPVSFAQQRLWFLDRLTKGHLPTYHMPFALRMRGQLDALALQRAVGQLLQRHESLRTYFGEVADQPVQKIAPAWQVVVPVIDLTVGSSERLVRTLAAAEAVQPFALDRVPLWRVHLLRLGIDEHVLLLTKHHIISDGWSLGVMVSELVHLYRALVLDTAVNLPRLAVQYADVASWQRRQLNGERRQALIHHWQAALSGAPRLHQLPTDRPRPARMQAAAAVVHRQLNGPLTQQLQRVAAHHKVTWFMLLEAVFGLLLSRLSGQLDVLIGTPTANRRHAEMESLIGFFVNTLVLRNDLRGVDDWSTYLERVKQMTLAAFDHEELPFELLVEALEPERAMGHTPLFQVMFVLQNTPASELSGPGLKLESLAWAPPSAKYDLTLSVQENDSSTLISAEYSTSLFDADSIHVFLSAYHSLLKTAASEEGLPLKAWPLLDQALRQRVVHHWNNTADNEPLVAMPDRLNLTAQRYPARIALAWQGNPDTDEVSLGGQPRLMTYGYMHRAAQYLAIALVARGVKPGQLVGVGLDRSPAALVAFWAIWQVGAAYVPLDPALPTQRLTWMIEDAGLSLVVTAKTATPLEHSVDQLAVDMATGLPCTQTADPLAKPPVRFRLEQVAYMIYTSGSTGQPKAVLIQHRALANLAGHHCRADIARADNRTLLFVALSFDASVWQWLTAHAAGGALIVPKPAVALLGANLARWLRTYAITHITMTPSALAEVSSDHFPALRVLTSGGEACSLALFQDWSQQCRFINGYGPTETTVSSSQLDSARDQLPKDQPFLPIGVPGPNVQHYVLDRLGGLLPPGIPGELAIGGVQVGCGYHRRPTLTAQRFVPDPFGAKGGRLYLSGDRVRWCHDGQMAFLGRIDRQVKLRGYRIEPGEIEACCRALAIVRDVAVVVHRNNDERLVAFVTLHPSATGDSDPIGVIRRHMQAQLPAYQVPAVVVLEALPTTAHHKVDLETLAGQSLTAWASQTAEVAFTAPATDTERRLARLWMTLLNRDRIGRYEHFFDAGGHSLLAVRLINAVSREFGMDLPLENLFEEPTLHKLAQLIDLLAEPPQTIDGEDDMEEGAL